MVYNKHNCIVWIDTELTGLQIETDTILEIACLITDEDLNIVSEEFNIVINQPDLVLEHMNEWCMNFHTKSGLIQESKYSKITLKDAEEMLLNFLKKYIPSQTCPLAGNTIYMDRLFLLKYMPLVNDYLHYRIIDVSTIKELVRRWNSNQSECTPKKFLHHRALPDIKESIEELKYYKKNIFMSSI
ncbi:probable oligoribonuclease isoform X1 [Apis cerana]|uniref:Probable oligoribonuclease n=1 Tax=Apis cerana cerana TaxID=94128 RepID=A0A2A3ENT1_APICC|nr:probable oligoribonuclease isoform X1 [Apis cerana]XP_061932400.1 probable oligoribonuclease isoform X1 [Apis cerana]PBC33377.1 oligoribonuclease [Apis cerana cerana]